MRLRMNLSSKLKSRNERMIPVTSMVATLFLMYIISGVLLLLLAFLLYKMELTESVVKIAVIVIYIISGGARSEEHTSELQSHPEQM